MRYGELGRERPAVIAPDGTLRDLSAVVQDIAGLLLTAHGLDELRRIDHQGLPRVVGSPRMGAPVANTGKMICVGLNYSDHAVEAGMPVPELPVVFIGNHRHLWPRG